MKYLLTCLFLLTFIPLASQAQSGNFSSLEERMTAKEFNDAGLNKLSAEELRALNEWLRSGKVSLPAASSAASQAAPAAAVAAVPAAAAATASGDDSRGFEQKRSRESNKDPIVSTVVGEFTGWNGNTVFKLENGMIWQQNDNDTYYYPASTGVQVNIEPGFFGTWRLNVVGKNTSVKVVRIE